MNFTEYLKGKDLENRIQLYVDRLSPNDSAYSERCILKIQDHVFFECSVDANWVEESGRDGYGMRLKSINVHSIMLTFRDGCVTFGKEIEQHIEQAFEQAV